MKIFYNCEKTLLDELSHFVRVSFAVGSCLQFCFARISLSLHAESFLNHKIGCITNPRFGLFKLKQLTFF